MKAEIPNRNASGTASAAKGSGADELRAILHRRWKIAAPALVVPLGVALGLALFLPGLYQARAVVLVQPTTEPGGVADDFSLRIEQLTRQNLARPRLVALIEAHQVYPRLRVVGDDAASALRRDVDIETQRVEQSNGRISVAIAVSVRGRDPYKIAEVANDLAAFYVEAERAQHEVEAAATAAELAQVKLQLAAEEGRVKDFDEKNLGELPEQVQLHMVAIAQFNAQLDAVRATHARAVERWGSLAPPTPGAPPPAVALPAAVHAEPTPAEVELGQAEAELRDLRSRYTEQHPEVLRVLRQVEVLRTRTLTTKPRSRAIAPAAAASAQGSPPARMGTGYARARAQVTDEIQGLEAQERDLVAKIAAAQQAALNAPRREHERAALFPEVQAARDLYGGLLKRYQELTGAGAGKNPFHIFEEAVPGHSQVAPKRVRLAVLGLIFALLFAGGAVWLAEQTDRTFHSSRELRAFAGLPILGTIPRIVTASAQLAARRRAFLVGAAAAAGMVAVLAATWFWASGNEALVRMLFRR